MQLLMGIQLFCSMAIIACYPSVAFLKSVSILHCIFQIMGDAFYSMSEMLSDTVICIVFLLLCVKYLSFSFKVYI